MTSSADRYCLLSADVEMHSIWYNAIRPETGRNVLRQGLPRLLDLYEKYGVETTFFFTGDIARAYPDVVRSAHEAGHEVGCHGLSHEVHHAFDVLPPDEQRRHLREAKAILEDLTGDEVVSFRAPALRVNEHTPAALAETGFRIDSSVSPQRFDLFLSFGGRNKLKWLQAPRKPYVTDPHDLARAGRGGVVEVPISSFVYPYIGTTLRIAPSLTRLVRSALHLEARRTGKPVVFLTHPNEFLDERNGHRHIPRRSPSWTGYLLKDLIRGHLKIRNLGAAAVPLYEREIDFFVGRDYTFCGMRTYCRLMGFDV